MAGSPGSTTTGSLNIRSSTQVPFLTRRALADIFGLAPDKVRVFCERVGGGFGGKQEMFVEDILALAALKTGRPVKFELTREEQFISTSTRHPMRVTVKAGADKDGKLTALQLDVLSNTGAYGNHAGPVLFHACGECIAVYNCPNKKVDAVVAYTNTVPAGAFRGYGLPQTAVRGRSRDRRTGQTTRHRSFRDAPPQYRQARRSRCCRRRHPNITTCFTAVMASTSASTSSSVRCRRRPRTHFHADWLIGDGIALTMIDTVPPDGHFADCTIALRDDGGFELAVGTAEFGNGTHCASPDRRDRAGDHRRSYPPQQSDTAHGGHDTGAYGSAGIFVAGRATQAAAENLARDLRRFASPSTGIDPVSCMLENEAAVCGRQRLSFTDLAESARGNGRALAASGSSAGTPRSVAFNVQGFRVAVNKATGEIQILKSVHAADAGRVANPDAMPRPGRRRRRAIARRCAV